MTALELAFVAAAALLAAVVALVVVDALSVRAKVDRRLRPLSGMSTIDEAEPLAQKSLAQNAQEENALVQWLNVRFPLSGGVRTGVVAVVVAVVVTTLVGPFLMFVGLGPMLAMTCALTAGVLLGWNVGKAREDGERTSFNDRFLLAMEDFQRMVRFGIPTMQALNSVADATDAPLKPVLRNVLLDAGLGVPLERAMAREAHRIGMGELAMLAAILSTQADTGGNLSEAVGNLADMLRERRDNRTKMKAATAESRVTLIILCVVPILGIGLQATVQPELVTVLVNEGRHLLGIGLAFIFGGLAISWLMIRSAGR